MSALPFFLLRKNHTQLKAFDKFVVLFCDAFSLCMGMKVRYYLNLQVLAKTLYAIFIEYNICSYNVV